MNSTISKTVFQIVETAMSPDEWAAFPNAVPLYSDANCEAAEKLLAKWEKLIRLKVNDASAFDKRLQNLGLDRESAIARLIPRTLPANANLPSWAKLLSEVLTNSNFAQPLISLQQLQTWTDEEIKAYSFNRDRSPIFPEFLHPFISVVLRQISAKTPNLPQIISDSAWEQIARYLLLRLSQIAARIVAFEVKQRRFKGKLIGENSEQRYQYFVGKILGTPDGLSELFIQYPILARLLAVVSEQMVIVIAELLQRIQEDSVLSSCISFFWRAGNYDQILFCGTGINGCGDRPWHTGIIVWQGIGTDQLKRTHQDINFNFNNNLPRCQGDKIPVNDYIDEAIQGFFAAYRTLMQHREQILCPQGILAEFCTVTTRSVLRDTNDYAGTLFWSLNPNNLTSGAAYDVALELLYTELSAGSSITISELLDEEKRCCWQQNIPSYYSSPVSHSIYSSSGVSYELAINQTSFEQMQQRLSEASEEDLIWQSELLRVSLEMSVYPSSKSVESQKVINQNVDNNQLSLLSLQSSAINEQWLLVSGWSNWSENSAINSQLETKKQPLIIDNQSLDLRLLEGAISLGDALVKLAMSHDLGNSWLCFSKVAQNSTMVAPLHPFPWTSMGAAGTSIFLANLARQTKDERYEHLARGAWKFTECMLQEFIHRGLWEEISISGYNGICLYVYALTEGGRCFQDDVLCDRALEWALKLTPDRLRKEQNPDILGGAAGALLALLHLHKVRPDSSLIERAIALGESILNCQETSGISQGWRVPNFERSLLGMGHGAAGIACALLRLYAITGEEQFRISAESGLAYERANFCHEIKDWPNLQKSPGKAQFMTGWCAGAPGIGLARLGILGILGDESEIRDEIDLAIAATQRHLGKHQHHLCCGEASRIAFLSAAAQHLERPELFPVAVSAALKMMDFYEQTGHWKLQEFSERNIIPGLLDGVSGIGLTLLGLISPSLTSQVMLLD